MCSRRIFIQQSFLALTGSIFTGQVAGKPKEKRALKKSKTIFPSLNGKKVFFTYGGWDGHEPKKFRDYMVPWMKYEGAEVEISDSLALYEDKDFMDSRDLIIQIRTMSEITKEQEQGLLGAVKKGCGMAGWHGGMCDSFRNNVDYQYMTSGQWVAHPGGIVDYSVQLSNLSDEITEGLSGFDMKSEQYYMHIDPNVKVLATTTFKGDHDEWINGCVMPVCWKKYYGEGRIFYTSLGHNLDHVTEVPDAILMIKRGIQWASDSKYAKKEVWVNPVYKSI